MARPKKGQEKWNPEYCEKLIEHMEKGFSFESFAAVIELKPRILYTWRDKHPEFKDAFDMGLSKGRYYWEVMGINGAAGELKNFSASVWIFTMKCRFGYRDGTETGLQSDNKEDSVKIYKTQWRESQNKAKKDDGEKTKAE